MPSARPSAAPSARPSQTPSAAPTSRGEAPVVADTTLARGTSLQDGVLGHADLLQLSPLHRVLVRVNAQLWPPAPEQMLTSVRLVFSVEQATMPPASLRLTVHRVRTDWAEAEATWTARVGSLGWVTGGGDYVAAPSAVAFVNSSSRRAVFEGPGLVADVLAWQADPLSNMGWLVRTSEDPAPPADASVRLYSREASHSHPIAVLVYGDTNAPTDVPTVRPTRAPEGGGDASLVASASSSTPLLIAVCVAGAAVMALVAVLLLARRRRNRNLEKRANENRRSLALPSFVEGGGAEGDGEEGTAHATATAAGGVLVQHSSMEAVAVTVGGTAGTGHGAGGDAAGTDEWLRAFSSFNVDYADTADLDTAATDDF